MSRVKGGAHAAAPGEPPTVVRGAKRKGFYKSEVEREAFRQGMTVEEYGVYKGSVGSSVKPINSAGGLLVISIIMSVCTGIAVVACAILWIQDGFNEALEILILMPVGLGFTCWGWIYFAREHRAEKLRKARGITLIRPE